MWSRTKNIIAVALASVSVVAGCSGDVEVMGELFPVSGVIKIDDKPIANASVIFSPLKGTKGSASFGTTDETGAFTLQKRSGKKGIEEGKYQLGLSKIARKDGTPFPPDTSGEILAAEGVEHVPARFANPEPTDTIYEVPKGGKKFEISLSSKGPASSAPAIPN